VPKKSTIGWAQLCATLDQLSSPAVRSKPGDAIQLVLDAGYEEHLQDQYPDFRVRIEDLDQLAIFARQFGSLEDFLGQLALATNLDGDEDQPSSRDREEGLRLSTIHQAKGLEFDAVFVIMLGDGLFPSYRSLEDPEAIEEERRLFYVALTRARNELYLSYPLLRPNPGRDGDFLQLPSRFLSEIPDGFCESLELHGHV
jgi:DNA helicase-2/ATP-dependent DNA helicase PcrA